MGRVTHPAIGYHHNAWPSADGNHLFVTDEFARQSAVDITIWDISQPDDPVEVGSIVHRFGKDFVEWGTNVLYAAIHQLGGTIRPKTAKRLRFTIGDQVVFARQVTIPPRPFVGVDNDDRAEIRQILVDHLEDSLR